MKYMLILLLAGCSSTPYWIEIGKLPVEVKHVVRVDFPKGQRNPMLADHWNEQAQTCEINRAMSPAYQHCALHHCFKHAAGFAHIPDRINFAMDCGDGRVM